MSAYAAADLIPTGPEPPVKVRAVLSLRTEDNGGRRTGIRSGYRPNHNFGDSDNRRFYVGQVNFGNTELINPGESREVLIEFLRGPGLTEVLKVGVTWRIQEGPKFVATARVLEVLDGT